ncbi:MAG: aldose 1-epimerase [Ruminococcus sp.]|nr:aldose 1-epimerase [Ruminococcus sp.]
MNSIISEYDFNGIRCVRMQHGKYTCIVAPGLGASVLRLRDEENRIEVFRYNKNASAQQIESEREIWGLPTLYLPNRFEDGIIKTSDGLYKMPINVPDQHNYIHGWVHRRPHVIESIEDSEEKCVLVTSFTHDSKDEMYTFFPVDFKISYTFTLSDEGLRQEISLTNLSDKALPVSLCTHTTINAPMSDEGEEKDLRLFVPVVKRCELNERCLPTQELLALNDWDKEYLTGKMPTLQVIDNDMYTAGTNKLDGEDFYGAYVKDTAKGTLVLNRVSKEFRFWNMWNQDGVNHYFCPEPMTAMINCTNLTLPHEVTGYCELSKGQSYTCWQSFCTRKVEI